MQPLRGRINGYLTYCKGLPTPANELNELGFTDFEMFLEAYAPIFRTASIETVNHLLLNTEFKKSDWNTHLQQTTASVSAMQMA
jgi:hypothetical protein